MDVYAWIVLITAVSIQTFSSGVSYTYGIFSPDIFGQSFNITDSRAIIPATVFHVAVSGIGLFIVPIFDILGWQWTLMLGISFTLVGFISTYFLMNFSWIIIMFGIFPGVGLGICDFVSLVAVQVYFEKNIIFGNNLTACGYEIGPAVFGPLIGLVANTYGWRVSMLGLAGICVISYISCFILKPPIPPDDSSVKPLVDENGSHNKGNYSVNECITDGEEKTYSTIDCNDQLNASEGITEMSDANETETNNVLKHPVFLLLCVSYVFFVLHYLIGYMYITLKSANEGLSANKCVWLFTTIALSSVILRLTLTMIIKDFNVFMYSAGVAGVIASAASLVMPLFTTYPLLLVYSVIWGGCQGICWPSYYNMTNKIDTSHTKKYGVAGLFVGATVGGALLPLAGVVIEAAETVNAAYIFGGASGLFSAIAFIMLNYFRIKQKG